MRHDAHFVDQLVRADELPVGRRIPIHLIDANPDQPRSAMGDLAELTKSIASRGVLEPILVRAREDGRFTIISGERRYRAALEAGLAEIPCIEMEVTDSELLEIALVENLQRQDLSAFEEAEGFHTLVTSGLLKISVAIVLSPALGFALGMLLLTAVAWLLFRTAPHKVDRWFRRLQLVSASLYSLGHGGNDAQKTMGIIALILVAYGSMRPDFKADEIPFWVVLSCQAAIALGTLFGGWRIVKTMGQKITKLKPVGGFCAETGGAITLFLATGLGIPVSTTHTITGAIVGVGAVHKLSAVRWGVAGGIVWAWILTIPCSAFMAAVAWWVSQQIF